MKRMTKSPVGGEFLKSRGDGCLIESATVPLPEVRTEVAINDYEQEVGKVAGKQAFRALYKVYLIHATLGEMKFSKILPMRRKLNLVDNSDQSLSCGHGAATLCLNKRLSSPLHGLY